jgi:uncharacterized protein (DUF433 family)
MLNDDARSLQALSIALKRLQALPDEKTQLELNKVQQAIQELRLMVRQCSPLLEFYDEAFDELQESSDSTPRNKFINSSIQQELGNPDGTPAQGLTIIKQPYEGIDLHSGTSGIPTPVIRGTNIRVQTIAIAHTRWQQSASEIAEEYDLTETQVQSALEFYDTHRTEIDAAIALEQAIEAANV